MEAGFDEERERHWALAVEAVAHPSAFLGRSVSDPDGAPSAARISFLDAT